jgi:DNA-binding NarL/FixJ family response regulator
LGFGGIIIGSTSIFLAGVLQERMAELFRRSITRADNDDVLLTYIQTSYPRLVFLEHCLKGQATDEFIARLVKRHPDLHIAVWAAAHVAPLAAARFILAGAESFLSLRDDEEKIQANLQKILSGVPHCPVEVEAVLEEGEYAPVIGAKPTSRECEVIRHSIDGLSNEKIAEAMGVEVCTVKMHKANLYRKCNGNTPVHLLKYGLLQGTITVADLAG